jgi:hypothetical protein
MENGKGGSFVNVKTKDGRVLLSLFPAKDIILEGRLDTVFRQEAGEKKGGNGNGGSGGNGGNGGSGNGELMTYPQKRYLFRILAQQGIEGNKVQEHLLKLFQADSMKDVTKQEASRMIERLLKESEGGENGGIPF